MVPVLAVEIIVRVNPGEFFGRTHDPYHHLRQGGVHPMEFDEELGWVPRPGRYENFWGNRPITITPRRIRSNGNSAAHATADENTILVAGDSYTFGDGVGDGETWPAYLESTVNARVYNAGVTSYGFDQSVLRAERLLSELKPSIVIVSLIEADIRRTEVSSRFNAAKPFFWYANDEITLDSTPLLPWEENTGFDAFEWFLDRSAVLRLVFRNRLYPQIFRHRDGTHVSCGLMRRLATLQRVESIPVIILAQQESDLRRETLVEVQQCAVEAGLDVIDTFPALAETRHRSEDDFEELFWDAHMSPAGNRFVATIVRDHLAGASYGLSPRD